MKFTVTLECIAHSRQFINNRPAHMEAQVRINSTRVETWQGHLLEPETELYFYDPISEHYYSPT